MLEGKIIGSSDGSLYLMKIDGTYRRIKDEFKARYEENLGQYATLEHKELL